MCLAEKFSKNSNHPSVIHNSKSVQDVQWMFGGGQKGPLAAVATHVVHHHQCVHQSNKKKKKSVSSPNSAQAQLHFQLQIQMIRRPKVQQFWMDVLYFTHLAGGGIF